CTVPPPTAFYTLSLHDALPIWPAIARITELSGARDRPDLAGRHRHESPRNDGEKSAAFHGNTFHVETLQKGGRTPQSMRTALEDAHKSPVPFLDTWLHRTSVVSFLAIKNQKTAWLFPPPVARINLLAFVLFQELLHAAL